MNQSNSKIITKSDHKKPTNNDLIKALEETVRAQFEHLTNAEKVIESQKKIIELQEQMLNKSKNS